MKTKNIQTVVFNVHVTKKDNPIYLYARLFGILAIIAI